MDDKDDEMLQDYIMTLEDLTYNSKPHINALTILADENKMDAAKIVTAIEHRLRTAPPDQKLYPLYLIDSIIKNLPDSDYLSIFTNNIVSLYTDVFEKVDEKTRLCMYKLRQTWPDLFPNKSLLSLDISIKCIDPRWPITALQPGDKAVGKNVSEKNKVVVSGDECEKDSGGKSTSIAHQPLYIHQSNEETQKSKHQRSPTPHSPSPHSRSTFSPLQSTPSHSHFHSQHHHHLPQSSTIHVNPAFLNQESIRGLKNVRVDVNTDKKKKTMMEEKEKNERGMKGRSEFSALSDGGSVAIAGAVGKDPRRNKKTLKNANKQRKELNKISKETTVNNNIIGGKQQQDEEEDDNEAETQLKSQLLAKQQELLQIQLRRLEMQLKKAQQKAQVVEDSDDDEEKDGVGGGKVVDDRKGMKDNSSEKTNSSAKRATQQQQNHTQQPQQTKQQHTQQHQTQQHNKQLSRKKNVEVAKSLLNRLKGAGITPLNKIKMTDVGLENSGGSSGSGGDGSSGNCTTTNSSNSSSGKVSTIPSRVDGSGFHTTSSSSGDGGSNGGGVSSGGGVREEDKGWVSASNVKLKGFVIPKVSSKVHLGGEDDEEEGEDECQHKSMKQNNKNNNNNKRKHPTASSAHDPRLKKMKENNNNNNKNKKDNNNNKRRAIDDNDTPKSLSKDLADLFGKEDKDLRVSHISSPLQHPSSSSSAQNVIKPSNNFSTNHQTSVSFSNQNHPTFNPSRTHHHESSFHHPCHFKPPHNFNPSTIHQSHYDFPKPHHPFSPPRPPPSFSPPSPSCTQASGWASFKASHPSSYPTNAGPNGHNNQEQQQQFSTSTTLPHDHLQIPPQHTHPTNLNNKDPRHHKPTKRKALLPTPDIPAADAHPGFSSGGGSDTDHTKVKQPQHEVERLECIRDELMREEERLHMLRNDQSPMGEFEKRVRMSGGLLDERMLEMDQDQWTEHQRNHYNPNNPNNRSLLPAPPKCQGQPNFQPYPQSQNPHNISQYYHQHHPHHHRHPIRKDIAFNMYNNDAGPFNNNNNNDNHFNNDNQFNDNTFFDGHYNHHLDDLQQPPLTHPPFPPLQRPPLPPSLHHHHQSQLDRQRHLERGNKTSLYEDFNEEVMQNKNNNNNVRRVNIGSDEGIGINLNNSNFKRNNNNGDDNTGVAYTNTVLSVDKTSTPSDQLKSTHYEIPVSKLNDNIPPVVSQSTLSPIITSSQSNNASIIADQSKSSNPIDVLSLVNQLLKYGMIGSNTIKSASNPKISTIEPISTTPHPTTLQPTTTQTTTTTFNTTINTLGEEIPDLSSFDVNLLKKNYRTYQQASSCLTAPSHNSFQCANCGLTFPPHPQHTKLINQRYKDHLDWHFSLKKQHLAGNKTRKPWKYMLDWVHSKSFNPISYANGDKSTLNTVAKDEKDEDSDADMKKEDGQEEEEDDVIASLTLASKNSDDSCQLCNEKFDYYWSDDKDAWLLSDAVVFEGSILHKICLPDFQKALLETFTTTNEDDYMEGDGGGSGVVDVSACSNGSYSSGSSDGKGGKMDNEIKKMKDDIENPNVVVVGEVGDISEGGVVSGGGGPKQEEPSVAMGTVPDDIIIITTKQETNEAVMKVEKNDYNDDEDDVIIIEDSVDEVKEEEQIKNEDGDVEGVKIEKVVDIKKEAMKLEQCNNVASSSQPLLIITPTTTSCKLEEHQDRGNTSVLKLETSQQQLQQNLQSQQQKSRQTKIEKDLSDVNKNNDNISGS